MFACLSTIFLIKKGSYPKGLSDQIFKTSLVCLLYLIASLNIVYVILLSVYLHTSNLQDTLNWPFIAGLNLGETAPTGTASPRCH
jgi:hypothetical protein